MIFPQKAEAQAGAASETDCARKSRAQSGGTEHNRGKIAAISANCSNYGAFALSPTTRSAFHEIAA